MGKMRIMLADRFPLFLGGHSMFPSTRKIANVLVYTLEVTTTLNQGGAKHIKYINYGLRRPKIMEGDEDDEDEKE